MAGSSSSQTTDWEVIDVELNEPMLDTYALATSIQVASLLPSNRPILQSASEADSVAAPGPPAWSREEEEWARWKTARTGKAKAEAKGTGKGRSREG